MSPAKLRTRSRGVIEQLTAGRQKGGWKFFHAQLVGGALCTDARFWASVIEIANRAEKVNAFLPALEAMIGDGMVTMERLKVIHCRPTEPKTR